MLSLDRERTFLASKKAGTILRVLSRHPPVFQRYLTEKNPFLVRVDTSPPQKLAAVAWWILLMILCLFQPSIRFVTSVRKKTECVWEPTFFRMMSLMV